MAVWQQKNQKELTPEQIQKKVFRKTLEPELLPPADSEHVSDPAQLLLTPEPKHTPNRKRSELLSLRLTPEELAFLNERAQAAGMSRTDFILAACRGEMIVVVDGVQELYQELRKQGVNFNQAVRWAKAWRSTNLAELAESRRKCYEVQETIARFIDFWNVKLLKKKEEKGNANIDNQSIEGDAGESN